MEHKFEFSIAEDGETAYLRSLDVSDRWVVETIRLSDFVDIRGASVLVDVNEHRELLGIEILL